MFQEGTKSVVNTTPEAVPAAPNAVVVAFAGTGKTFTQIVGVGWAFGQEIWPEIIEGIGFDPVPSPEQQLVWDALRESTPKTVTYCAFNRSIVSEFSDSWGWMQDKLRDIGLNLQFATINGLGHRVICNTFGRVTPISWRTENIIGEILACNTREMKRRDPITIEATGKLVGLCKLTLVGWTDENGFDADQITHADLDELADHYEIDLNDKRDKVYGLVPEVLRRSLDLQKREIDWDDQNWLPVVLDLPIPKVDLLLVDEGQDLNRCKQQFCLRAGRRTVLVGDINQAVYGFAGADVDSIPRMQNLLKVDNVLRLTETRRCGKAIVAVANQTLKRIHHMRGETHVEFTAHESNPNGKVSHAKMDTYADTVEDGDMVLCRVNAPLISEALKHIKAGRKALVRGRDFGGQLVKFVDRMKPSDPGDLVEQVDNWYQSEFKKERRKRNPSDAKLISLETKRDCIYAFAEDSLTIAEIKAKMELVFCGKVCPCCDKRYNESAERCGNRSCKTQRLITPKGILHSSIHRAKGLEANRVFLLQPKGASVPHPMAKSTWQIAQEWHCLYIAQTRAIEEFTTVEGV
tara:strand:- start:18221 stop:19951 length:1731 start_codon:yes stop_codon:yes gene_type:complete